MTFPLGESDFYQHQIGQFRRVLLSTLLTYIYMVNNLCQEFCRATEFGKLQSTAETQNNYELSCHGQLLLSIINDNNILTGWPSHSGIGIC